MDDIANAPIAVVAFCRDWRISNDVQRLVNLVRKRMRNIVDSQCRLENDSDSDASWIVVEVTVSDSATLLEDYDVVVNEWVRVVDACARDSIKFTFSLA
jgi:hypothetical protein